MNIQHRRSVLETWERATLFYSETEPNAVKANRSNMAWKIDHLEDITEQISHFSEHRYKLPWYWVNETVPFN